MAWDPGRPSTATTTTPLLGQWNHARWGQRLRRKTPPGWSAGRTRLLYLKLTEAEWTGLCDAAHAAAVTIDQWVVTEIQRGLTRPVPADAAAARRLQARRDARR